MRRISCDMRRGARGKRSAGGGGGPTPPPPVKFADMRATGVDALFVSDTVWGVSAAPFTIAYVGYLIALPVADTVPYIYGRTSSSIYPTRGTAFCGIAANQVLWTIRTPSGATQTPAHAHVAGDVGKCHRYVLVHDGSAVRLYVNGVQVGAGTAVSGFTAPSADRIWLGYGWTWAGSNCEWLGCIGLTMTNSALSGAQIATWDASVVSAGAVQHLNGSALTWDANDWSGTGIWADKSATYGLSELTTNETVTTLGSPTWA